MSEINDDVFSSTQKCSKMHWQTQNMIYTRFLKFAKWSIFHKNEISKNSLRPSWQLFRFFIWSHFIHSKTLQGVVVDHKKVQDKTNWRASLKNRCLPCRITDWTGNLVTSGKARRVIYPNKTKSTQRKSCFQKLSKIIISKSVENQWQWFFEHAKMLKHALTSSKYDPRSMFKSFNKRIQNIPEWGFRKSHVGTFLLDSIFA